jgi:hypothetical protein
MKIYDFYLQVKRKFRIVYENTRIRPLMGRMFRTKCLRIKSIALHHKSYTNFHAFDIYLSSRAFKIYFNILLIHLKISEAKSQLGKEEMAEQ